MENTLVVDCLQILGAYPSKFQEYILRLSKQESNNQALSDRLIWCELDVDELGERMTRFLVISRGLGFLDAAVANEKEMKIKLGVTIGENVFKIVNSLQVLRKTTNDIIKSLMSNQLPLKKIGILIVKANLLHDALCRINFE